jgi:hypothetical protein
MTLLQTPRRTIREQRASARVDNTGRLAQDAKRAQLRERAEFTRLTGREFDPFRDGQLVRDRRTR